MKTKRISEVEEYISENGTVSIDELTETFHVSINTIRRDINELVKRNSVKKVYGGVTSTNKHNQQAIDYTERNVENYEKKKSIGNIASGFIEQHDIVYIDTGTTTTHVLDNIDEKLEFTIITNSLDVINKASHLTNVDIYVIGEKYAPRTRSFIGIKSQDIVGKFNIKKAFMSATGVNIKNGLSNAEMEENMIKQRIIKQSEKKYALVDHSKIGESTLLTYMELKDLDYLITDTIPDSNFVDFCNTNSVEIITE